MTIRVLFNRVLITDRGFKAVSWPITSNFNSTFGTSGKAAADKMSGKSRRETQAFALVRKINLNLLSCSEARLRNFEQFLAFS